MRVYPVWVALLVAASIAFSLGFACAVPLAAFAAATALTAERRDALLIVAAVWLANQAVGFLLLGYPWTWQTFAWGAVLGAVALLATEAARAAARPVAGQAPLVAWLASFAAAFAVYEGGLFLVSVAVQSGVENYALPIVAWIFTLNALAFAALMVLQRIGAKTGLARPLARAA